MNLYRVTKNKEIITYIYIWAKNPNDARIKATTGSIEKIKNKEGFEKIEIFEVNDPRTKVEDVIINE